MKRRITNIYELRTEIVRAEADRRESERKMKDSLSKVGNELQPGKILRSAAGSILKGSDGKNTAVGTVLETVLSAAVSGLLFKNAGPVVKTVGSALGSAVANQVFGEEGAKVMERVKGLVSKIRAKTKSKSKGEGFDESNNYETGRTSES